MIETQQDCWVLKFDGHPPSLNDRMHWRTRAKVTKHWRSQARLRASLAGIPKCERIRVCAVIHRRALGVADEDNDRSRLKPVVDGLVDAGVIPNDARGQVEWGTVLEERGPKSVTVWVTRVSGEE